MRSAPWVSVVAFLVAGCGGGGGAGSSGDSGGGLDPSSIATRSGNWSGYFHGSSGSPVTRVAGSWIVPEVQCGAGENSATSTWTGVGGQSDGDALLIQAGSVQECNGGPNYYAWWEGFPAPAVMLDQGTYDVRPGDMLTVSLDGSSQAAWAIHIYNARSGWTFDTTVPFANAGLSGEWIQEAPLTAGSGGAGQSDLSNFGRLSFFGLTLNGNNPGLTTDDAIVMVNGSGGVVASPSAPSSGNSFSVCFGSGACR